MARWPLITHCDASPTASTPEASSEEFARWKRTFESYAKTPPDGKGDPYLDEEGFLAAVAPPEDLNKIPRATYALLFRVASSTGVRKTSVPGRLSFNDFVVFESLLKRPDAEFEVAFRYFDQDGNGEVTWDEFKRVLEGALGGKDSIPFDFDSSWVKLYLGKRGGQHVLGYNEFTQLMKGLQGERLRQSFRFFDRNETGYITPAQFQRIIVELARHKLSDSVLERLPSLCTLAAGGKISYSEVIAFHNIIREMDALENVLTAAADASPDGLISRSDFLTAASRVTRYSTFSPMEADVIFHFASPEPVWGKELNELRLSLDQFGALLDPKWGRPREEEKEVEGFWLGAAKSLYSFGLGGIAGALGATAVYPIDLVKTRMQNQRSKVVGELLYKNSMDCVKKVIKNEGFAGFYRGLPPQLVGVAPEKAIKLTINDLIRGHAKNPKTGEIALPWEFVAGGMAGGCQVAVTNPLEIVKIRLQMQGEAARQAGQAPRGAGHIIKQLGLVGLYRGAGACLMRDIPFSAIYFPGYAHLKKDYFGEGKNGKKLSFGETLAAAAIAGMPAAYLTTPADVVKTRLQSEARMGETTYKGLMDCFRQILKEEGPTALFKGGPARILRSSPQFGVTLVAYEYLQTFFPFPWGPQKVTTAAPPPEDLSRIRARNALKILLDVHGQPVKT